jgi:signal peptidase I
MTHARPLTGRDVFWDNVRTVLYALMLALVLRCAVAQPFRIPSGSMQPTMWVGDYILVTKWSYGFSRFSIVPSLFPDAPDTADSDPDGPRDAAGLEQRIFGAAPKRGDVAVFRPIRAQDLDLVKRVVGLPGDTIQVIDGVLHINGDPVQLEPLGNRPFLDWDPIKGAYVPIEVMTYRETLPGGASHLIFDRDPFYRYDNTSAFTLPPGKYFMMGDDRDNSEDSRSPSVGFVPMENFVGRADRVFFSFEPSVQLTAPWTLMSGFRGDRFWKPIE